MKKRFPSTSQLLRYLFAIVLLTLISMAALCAIISDNVDMVSVSNSCCYAEQSQTITADPGGSCCLLPTEPL